MAFTRKFLESLGLESDKVETVMEAHVEVVDALKKQRDDAKAKADEADDMRAELDQAKKKLADAEKDDWQAKYEEVTRDFEAYKATEAKKAADAEKARAYRDEVLGAAKVDPKRMDAIMRLVDLDEVEVDDKGHIKDAKKLAEGAAEEWAAFVTSTRTEGAQVAKPPQTSNAGGGNPIAQRLVAERMARYGVINESKQ